MSYKARANQQAFQRRWLRARRAEFFAGKTCHFCGETPTRPTLHHLDPAQKESHHIWSWKPERREAELAKCVAACYDCHHQHHAAEQRTHDHGTAGMYKRGCRCADCTRYNRERVRRQQARRAQSAPSPEVSPQSV